MEVTPAARGLRVTTAGREIVLDGPAEKTVGRGPSADVEVDDELVSRHHAVLRHEPGGWVLEDATSANGTFCDGQRVHRLEVARPLVVHLGDPERGPALELTPLTDDREETRAATVAGEANVPDVRVREGGLGRLTGIHTARQRLTIGRAEDNDIVLGDLLVSRRHAELRPSPQESFELIDLGSDNGTFVNGRRIQRAVLEPLDVIGIGRHSFRLVDGLLTVYEDTGDVTFQAVGLTVRGAGGEVMLDDVGFSLRERTLLAVVGPSGAGKSTLLKALTGLLPAGQGTVLYDGRDLYADFAELRGRIGF
ncbi:MAG: FHA domain-containing protein, partial [Gaiellaceae bacterium]